MLRKAYLLSVSTKQKDVEEWILDEQNGYKSADNLPDYRCLKGEIKALNNIGRWVPMHFNKQEQAECFSKLPFTEAITGIVEAYKNSSDGMASYSIKGELTQALNTGGSFATVYNYFVATGQLKQVISSV